MENGIKILSKEQITDLNKKGHNLDASGDSLYVIGFVLDDTPNNAADPEPFKVATPAVERIVSRGILRPWLPGKKGDRLHFRPHPDATDAEILEMQKNHAGGELVDYVMNDEGNRAWGIFKIWPEFKDMFEKEDLSADLPPFLSPMIGNWKRDEMTGEIIDGELLHVHSVDNPGYDRAYARFIGKCNGPIDQCMRELRPLAAAGLIKEWRHNSCPCPKNFLNTKCGLAASGMPPAETQTSDVGNGTSTPSLETVTKDVESLKQTYSSLSKEVSSIKTITEAMASKMGITTGGDENPAAANPAVAAAGKDQKKESASELKAIRDELAALKKEEQDRKAADEKRTKAAEEKERKRLARIIVAGEFLIEKSIAEDKRKEREEFYFNLKDKANPEKLQDLTLLAETYESKLQKLVPETEESEMAIAAAGLEDDYTVHGETEPNFDQIESSITEEI